MSTLTPWGPRFVDPFAVAPALFRRPAPGRGTTWYAPTTDVVREGEDAVVRLELPGVDVAKDVTVEVDGDRLSVRGERRDEQTGEGYRQSRYGSFRRSFTLPGHVDADAVSASYDAGVLTVRVTGAHAEATEPGARRIAIDGVPAPEETESTEAPETPAA
ncbi:Hsp20/alpha crystallin family protein [Actinomycetospora callitridis]|uniref:Hsp20/alpha crystallin family protein n=1 Tax=Actinomycetospora callitridis TaxID=913944 RepID=UPI002365780F|nr:Hsp20/alpha crystallin family protein [Actinomycetospora callitridis]MDD7921076.1 Hsp20/alpha crystallin family protein [Actinomycetospora callitridis]